MPLPPPPSATGISSLPPPPPPPAATAATGRWGLGDAFAALGVYLGVSIVVAIAYFAVEGEDTTLVGPWLPAFVLLPQVFVLLHLAFVMNRKGRGLARDLAFRFDWMDIPIGAAVAFVGLMVAGGVGLIVAELLGEDPTAAVADLLEESQDGGGVSVWIVLVAVFGATLVPVTEELLFRGLWWSALTKRGSSAVSALLLSSLAFTVFHLEPLRSPVIFTLGLALGWARLWTGRLGAAIVAHGLVNALAFTTLIIELS